MANNEIYIIKSNISNLKPIKYRTMPSDNEDWIIIELVDKKIKVDLEKFVLTYRYDCIPHNVNVQGKNVPCSRYCCYAGCYITPLEIEFIEKILDELKKNYLTKESLNVLKKYKDEFYLPEDYDEEEDLYKTRCAPKEPPLEHNTYEYDEELDSYEKEIEEIPETYCLFLMENGLCSIHKYLLDNNMNWPLYKFNICTTFPLDIRVTRNETSLDAPWPEEKRVDDDLSTIKMMDEFKDFLYVQMDCVNLSEEKKRVKGVPYIIESMRYAIETRFGTEMWLAIKDFAEKYRLKQGLPRK
ncbi:MAG: hypothetical protein ACTSRZ_04950 [Promethearchaeota archaeon]